MAEGIRRNLMQQVTESGSAAVALYGARAAVLHSGTRFSWSVQHGATPIAASNVLTGREACSAAAAAMVSVVVGGGLKGLRNTAR